MQRAPVNTKGYFAKSSANNVILLKKGDDSLPLGTRIYCKISKEIRYIGYSRLFLLSRGMY
jgi:ribosomal protein L14